MGLIDALVSALEAQEKRLIDIEKKIAEKLP